MRLTDLHCLDYRAAWLAQEAAHARVLAGGETEILLVEHPPVITLGRRAEESATHLVASRETLAARGIEVVESDRGGDVTLHAPGQLVAYPIVRIADYRLSVGAYVKVLEHSVIDCLARFGIAGRLEDKAIGVWTGMPARKICALGVRIKRGVALHGVALNVTTDLSLFDLIVPCGLAGRGVTSMARVLGEAPVMDDVKRVLVECLTARLGFTTSSGK